MREGHCRWTAVLWLMTSFVLTNCAKSSSEGGRGGASGSGGASTSGGSAGGRGGGGSGGGGGAGGAASGGHGGTSTTGGAGGKSCVVGAGAKAIATDACAISEPTHWQAGVYVASCNVDVTSTLTLDPGVIVKFARGFSMNVREGGMLTAVGTQDLPIVFTSVQDDAHGGDSCGDGATVAARNDWGCQGDCGDLNLAGSGSVLEFVQDLYGSNGVYVQTDSVKVDDSVFAHHGGYGLVVDGRFAVEKTVLARNAFFDNDGYPLRLGKAIWLESSNVFHDPDHPETKNKKQCIELDTDLDQLVMLAPTELGFLFSGHTISAEVIVPPETIFKVKKDRITLEASGLFVNGPSMIFTSYEDDSVGGDCTGDGDTPPADGDWEGLWIDDGTTADWAAPADYIRYPAKSGTMAVH